ncbi:TauD/TfdA family dioxygenase [Gordonia sp. PDNC005]|uniref:TauD/TfdA dioxygenase family protein n=1 Tax=unclassified Gordonia (in: high G+C Gram-positive bacteria) TaxID=2657482 RepID=UPI0019656C60|nr:TauD/TfdA family dioxygenase [Gordonia sp. PDNC005]QRY64190.1 TauD/TfdA family dioxygenase [Gordonia sp. PDNC005]
MTLTHDAPRTSIRAERLTAHLGAELFDVDLAAVAHDDDLFADLRGLLVEHKVLFVRDQAISRADHVALARRFGDLEDHPVASSDPDHPGLVRIYKDLDSPAEHYENAFHCDATWRECPPFGSVLRCVEGPAVGGDTIWVDMVAAYNALPDDVKRRINGLTARHSIEASFGAAMTPEKRAGLHAMFPDAEHPVVRTHPDTGEKILFVNAFATHLTNFHTPDNVRFGYDYAPGASELLNYLIRQASVPEFQVRWRWTPDSFAIWDNRCTQHYAVQDYWPAVRRMERAGIVGDRPY